jgi:ribokinase
MINGEILMLGDINIDSVWPVDEMPAPGRDAYIKEMNVELGGAVLNTAIVLDKLGIPTAMLSCIGKDIWADFVLEKLGLTSINLNHVQVRPEFGTGQTFLVVTSDGERTMFSFRGANIHYDAADLDEEVVKKAGMLHISGYSLLESPQRDSVWRTVEWAKQAHVPVSLDTGFEPVFIIPEDIRRIMEDVSICVTGPKETQALFGLTDPSQAAAHMLGMGVKLAAVKLGEKGCYVADAQGSFSCPAFKVDVVDTTGAGDSFTAGLSYGYLKGIGLKNSAILASALGAAATTVYGAGLALPGRQTALDFLKKNLDVQSGDMREGTSELVRILESD